MILLWVVGYAFFVFHGLSFHLTPWSQAFINAIVKYTYGRTGQDRTTVVLFREDNIRELGLQYPVPYAVHAQVLEALASYGPRAVFVDFAFIDPRPGEDVQGLAGALCALRAAGDGPRPVPVFVAAPEQTTVRPELLRCAEPVSPEMDPVVGVSGVLTYPAAHRGRPAAAFALAAADGGPAGPAPLEIIWGKGIHPLNRRWMDCGDGGTLPALWATLVRGPLAAKLACPYSRTLSVNHLLNSSGDRDVAESLTGKTVLYGADFRLTGDRVNSPVYAEMPGVYLHAMAYDNLVTFGPHYKRARRAGPGAWVTDAVLLLIAAVLLVHFPREEPPRAGSFGELKRRIRVAAVALPVALATVLAVVGVGGLDAALLVLFVAYVLYRWRVVRDLGFVLLAAVTLLTAFFYYYVIDLGPRNILAFFVFFEVVRRVEKHLGAAARRYFELKGAAGEPPRGLLGRVTDGLFALFAPPPPRHQASGGRP